MNRNALSTVLAELRVSGAIVLSQAHPVPWSIRVPPGNTLRGYLGVGDDVTVVPFHIAHRGHFDLHPADGDPIVVDANQLIMCANGQGHVMGAGDASCTRSFEDVMSDGSLSTDSSPASATAKNGNGIGHTEVVCGVFLLRNTKDNPLISSLPSLVKVDVYGPESSASMQKLHALLKDELAHARQGQTYMLERVLEMLYAESIRLYTESAKEHTPSWLTAINDVRIGPVINYIHANLPEHLTITALAQLASLSPSRFSACFRDLLGVSPKSYIAAQRQALAARRLLESKRSVQAIAYECGYQSMPSFNKAFVKFHGNSPARWRAERVSE